MKMEIQDIKEVYAIAKIRVYKAARKQTNFVLYIACGLLLAGFLAVNYGYPNYGYVVYLIALTMFFGYYWQLDKKVKIFGDKMIADAKRGEDV